MGVLPGLTDRASTSTAWSSTGSRGRHVDEVCRRVRPRSRRPRGRSLAAVSTTFYRGCSARLTRCRHRAHEGAHERLPAGKDLALRPGLAHPTSCYSYDACYFEFTTGRSRACRPTGRVPRRLTSGSIRVRPRSRVPHLHPRAGSCSSLRDRDHERASRHRVESVFDFDRNPVRASCPRVPVKRPSVGTSRTPLVRRRS